MKERYRVDYASPIGVIEISGTDQAIYTISYTDRERPEYMYNKELPHVITDCYHQLDEYFNGERNTFSVPYTLEGTDFQNEVWQALTTVPFGETATYQHIAKAVNREKAVRAVGSTNGKNKINIVIPCHRVIGSNGKLTGYGGGLWRKKWLLEHEQSKKEKTNS